MMVRRFICLAIPLLMLAASCSKNDQPPLAYHSFHGSFQRLRNGTGPEMPVTLTFTNGKWMGQSDSLYYPALSQGTYKVLGNRIYFQCETPWTANFDWSLILNNHYDFNWNGQSVTISRDYPNGDRDIYRLTRQ